MDDKKFYSFSQSKFLIFSGDDNYKLNPVSNEDFQTIFDKFNERFHDLDDVVIEIMSDMENQFDLVTEEVFFQDEAVMDILQTLNRNLDIMESNIQDQQKILLKDNIIIYGLPGTGKNTIINVLKSILNVPYADVALTPDFETNINKIALELINTAGDNLEDINHGIVFVRDNLDNLASYSDELLDDPFSPLRKLLSGVKFMVGDQRVEVNLDKLTFVIAMNVPSLSDIEDYLIETEDMPNMHYVMLNELTPSEQKVILLESKTSIINIYREILKKSDRELDIEEAFIDDLILIAKNNGVGMTFINDVISKIIKLEWHNGSSIISLTSNKLREIAPNIVDFDNVTERPQETKKTGESNQSLDESLDQLVEIVKQTVCAQDEHVKRILYTILRNRYAANSRELDNPKRYIKNILLRGESGSGKTAILTEIARILKLPIFIADATSYTEAGYVGNSVTDMLESLYRAADGDLEKAERGILVIDEIDKKSGSGTNSNVTRGAVLDGLLKIIEGTVVPIEIGKGLNAKQIMFNTARLTVICSGAFENIERVRDERLRRGVKKTIGFGSQVNFGETKVNHDPNIIDEDYVQYGMNRQFMARFGVIVNLNKLMVEHLKNIMMNSKTSELVIQKKLSELQGLILTYDESFYDALARKAFDKQIGARGIERAFNDVLDSIGFMNINPKDYQEVVFTGACVDNPNEIRLVPRENNKTLVKKIN